MLTNPTAPAPVDPFLRDQIIAALEEPFGSFIDILTGWARAQPDAIALADESKDVAWAELSGLV